MFDGVWSLGSASSWPWPWILSYLVHPGEVKSLSWWPKYFAAQNHVIECGLRSTRVGMVQAREFGIPFLGIEWLFQEWIILSKPTEQHFWSTRHTEFVDAIIHINHSIVIHHGNDPLNRIRYSPLSYLKFPLQLQLFLSISNKVALLLIYQNLGRIPLEMMMCWQDNGSSYGWRDMVQRFQTSTLTLWLETHNHFKIALSLLKSL